MGSKQYEIGGPRCLCGSANYTKLFERKDKEHSFEILRCINCGVARTIPVPDFSKERYKNYGIVQYLNNEKLARSFMNRIIKEITRFKKRGKLLEIGCNVGFLLETAKEKGFEIKGIELTGEAVEYANRLLGEEVVKMVTIEEAKFSDNYFDVVVMSHVLEHINNPINLLRETNRILKSDGIVTIVGPNFEGFCAKIKREKWSGLQPDEHVWQFGITTLKALLEKEGFRVARIKTSGLYHNLASVTKNIKDNMHDKGSPKHIIYSLLNWLSGKFNHGDNMFIIAIKYERKF